MQGKSFGHLCGIPAGILLALLSQPAWAGVKVEVGRPWSEPNRPSLTEVDHKVFNDLLHKYVDDNGLVAYAKWKASAADMQALDNYLGLQVTELSLGGACTSCPSR